MLARKIARSIVVMFAVLFSVFVLCSSALAQNEDTPKTQVFIGYQWLNPGGYVPSPGFPPDFPNSVKLPSLPYGVGFAYSYSFAPHVGIEGDYGINWNSSSIREQTVSVGPRAVFGGNGVSVFIHALVSWNRLDPPGLSARNGLGAILGGGMDLNLTRRFSYRLFEADYVGARQNFSDLVTSQAPGLERSAIVWRPASYWTGIQFRLSGNYRSFRYGYGTAD